MIRARSGPPNECRIWQRGLRRACQTWQSFLALVRFTHLGRPLTPGTWLALRVGTMGSDRSHEASPALLTCGLRYQFATFELDSKGLRCEGNPVAISAIAQRVLLHLVASGGRVVSREELFECVWPRVRVASGSLSQAIWEIRRLFRQHGGRTDLIRTRRGSGYQFTAHIAASSDALALASKLERALGKPWSSSLRRRVCALSPDALMTMLELVPLE